ncbi:MAG: DNRLRE domain-containing protein [Candidatus Magasanikbacteria bacterium]|nr:DNRLRE domain-containing protein [Candidatus Magasanikbacteria bacterium]
MPVAPVLATTALESSSESTEVQSLTFTPQETIPPIETVTLEPSGLEEDTIEIPSPLTIVPEEILTPSSPEELTIVLDIPTSTTPDVDTLVLQEQTETSFFATIQETVSDIVTTVEEAVEETIDEAVQFFSYAWYSTVNSLSGLPPELPEEAFNVVDSVTDVAYLPDGKHVYREFLSPRFLYHENGQWKARPADWHAFSEITESQLAPNTQGYSYQAPGETALTIGAGTLSVGTQDISPGQANFSQYEKNGYTVSAYEGVYPGIDVIFQDSSVLRQRSIVIHETAGRSFTNDVTFWEEYVIPAGTVVRTSSGEAISDSRDITGDHVSFELPSGFVFGVSDAIVFDASAQTPDEIDISPSLETVSSRIEIDSASGIARIGLTIPATYLQDAVRKYPVTIDPNYYFCQTATPHSVEQLPGVQCSGGITDLYLRYLASRETGTGDLFLGYYSGDPAGPATRQPVVKFSLAAIPAGHQITSASLQLYKSRNGLGNFNGDINTIARRITVDWNINNVTYQLIRPGLVNLGQSVVQTGVNGWYVWSVTAAAQSWYATPLQNYGLLVEPTPAWNAGAVPAWPNRLAIFSSSRNGDTNGPYLLVQTQVAQPDLRIQNNAIDDTTVTPGQVVNLSLDVINSGNAATNQQGSVYYYFKKDSRLYEEQYRVGSDTYPGLAVNTFSSETFQFTIPAGAEPGTYYLYSFVDPTGLFVESNENNNTAFHTITVSSPNLPNLVPEQNAVDDNTVFTGQQVTASTRVFNRGAAGAGNTSVLRYYLSTNQTYDANDTYLNQQDTVDNLAVGASNFESALVTIPNVAAGTYYILFRADYDNQIPESNENDNVGFVQVTVSIPIDPLEPNNTSGTATNLGALVNYNNNQTLLTAGDQDWFVFRYNNQNYYVKVAGLNANTAGDYNVSFSLVGNRLTAETLRRTGGTDTTLTLYGPDLLQLDYNDDVDNTLFSRIVYDLPLGGYCGGQCGGGGNPPPSENLPDQDNDTFADVEEAYGGTPIQNPNQRASLYNIGNPVLYSKVADKTANNYGADPVNLRTGSFEFIQQDFVLSGRGVPIEFTRTYNSLVTDKDSRLGNGWDFSQNFFYYQDPDTGNVQIYFGGSRVSSFSSNDGGQTFVAEKGNFDTLFWENNAIVYRTLEGIRYEFTNRLTSQLGILERIRDTNGNVTEFTYMVRRDVPLITQIRDASGRVVEFTYGAEDAANWQRIESLRERANQNQAEQRVILFTYNGSGNLIRVRDNKSFEGVTETSDRQYAYDANNRLTQYTDPRGTILYNEYDANGRVIRQREYNPRVDAAGSSRLVWELSYAGGRGDAPGSVACTTVTYHRSAASSYTEVSCFNADGLKVFFQDGAGASEKWTYDNNGMAQTYQDKNGNTTSYTHDARRRLTLEVLPETAWYTEVAYAYENNFNRLVRATERYRAANAPEDPLQLREKQFLYDNEHGNLTEARDYLGRAEFFAYDQYGNVIQFTNKNGHITSYVYDAQGNYRIRESIQAQVLDGEDMNVVKSYQYDPYGNVTVYTDPAGGLWQYAYDTRNNLRRTVDPLGAVRQYRYDAEDNKIQEINERGFITNYVYDQDIEASLLSIEQVGANGDASRITRFERDYLGTLVREIDPRGNATVYTHNGANLLTQKQMPQDTIVYAYDGVGNVIRETNSLGQQVAYQYDARNKRTQSQTQSDAGLVTVTTQYDAFSRPILVTDPNNSVHGYTYDAMDRVVSEVDALGGVTSYTYDAIGNKRSVLLPRAQADLALRNAQGNSVTYEYDSLRRLVRETNADNKQTLYFYDTRGNLIRTIDRQNANGTDNTHVTTYTYDAVNRNITKTMPEGGVTQMEYDGVGNMTRMTDAMNRATVYGYDTFNAQKTVTDAAGNQTAFTFDTAGNVTRTTYPDNTSVSVVYDTANRPIQVTDADNNTEVTTYDSSSNVVALQNRRGEITTFVYDASNRLIRETNPQNTATLYTYDAGGNKLSQSVDGETTSFAYDALNRVTTQTNPGNSVESYTYDREGHVLSFTDAKNQTTSYAYDALGRMTVKTPASNDWVQYQYNNWGMPTQIAENDTFIRNFVYNRENNVTEESHIFTTQGGPVVKRIQRTYNAAQEVTSLIDPANRAFDYVYNNRGLLSRVNYGATALAQYTYTPFGNVAATTFGNGVRTTYGYDALHRMDDMHVQTAGNQTLLRQAYSYDAGGNRLELQETFVNENGDAANRTVRYAYDDIDQLTSVNYTDRGAGNDLTFAYDAKGNRTTATAPFGSVNYGYNNAGQLTGVNQNSRMSVASSYDPNGSLTQEVYRRQGRDVQQVAYTWDAENRLAGITYTDMSRPNYLPDLAQNELSFVYDNSGNRIKKQANDEATYYVNTGLTVLSELNGQTLAVDKTLIPGVGTVAELEGDGTLSYVHSDVLGSTVLMTNAQGAVTAEYDYDVFGSLLGMKGSSSTGYLFTGQEFDPESNLYYYNARYYSPTLGRFISRDVYLGEAGDSLSRNRYVYVKNNPIKFVDPSGNVWETPWDIGNIIYDLGKGVKNTLEVAYHGAGIVINYVGENDEEDIAYHNEKAAQDLKQLGNAGVDLAFDFGATLVPFLPAGSTKAVRYADDVVDAGKVIKNSKPVEGIYQFTTKDGLDYVGQSQDITKRLQQHMKSGKLDANDLLQVKVKEVPGGKTQREIAEQMRINELGGIDKLSNKVNPIGPNRQQLLPKSTGGPNIVPVVIPLPFNKPEELKKSGQQSTERKTRALIKQDNK